MIEEMKKLVADYKPCGPITVQLIKDNETGENWYIEINPRFGGGAPLSMKAGANAAEALLRVLDGETVAGGVGVAEFEGLPGGCELQKLYLAPAFRGQGLGSRMIRFIEDRARELGYGQIYLETHTALQAALRAYERAGYRPIPRPASVIHTTMDRFYLKELCSG